MKFSLLITMQYFVRFIFFSLTISLFLTSCRNYYIEPTPEPTPTPTPTPSQKKYVQFFYEPEDGYLITYIKANAKEFAVSNTISSCLNKYEVFGDANGMVLFEMSFKNFKCLDVAFGAPYCVENYGSGFQVSNLKPGCNTLEIYRASTGRYVVSVKQ